MKIKIPSHIEKITPYVPGKPQEELEREYGVKNTVKLASNENSWGPSPHVRQVITQYLEGLHRYPDAACYSLSMAISEHFAVDPTEIVLGNGSNEIIELLVKSFVQEGDQVITSHPSFLMYQKFVQVRGGINTVIELKDMHHDLDAIVAAITPSTRLIFIDNPNNPTGTFLSSQQLEKFFTQIPESVIVVLDQAYVDYLARDEQGDVSSFIALQSGRCPVVLLRTFSKAYGISGLRVGFGLMTKTIADCLHKVRQPFNINSLAQVGALAAIKDQEYFNKVISETRAGLRYLQTEVERLGCGAFSSTTNFFLVDVKGSAEQLYKAMLYHGVIIRSMHAYGFPHYIRVTVGTKQENERFIKALGICLGELNYV